MWQPLIGWKYKLTKIFSKIKLVSSASYSPSPKPQAQLLLMEKLNLDNINQNQNVESMREHSVKRDIRRYRRAKSLIIQQCNQHQDWYIKGKETKINPLIEGLKIASWKTFFGQVPSRKNLEIDMSILCYKTTTK